MDKLTKKPTANFTLLFFFVVLLVPVLVSCAPQEPVLIRITPTPQPTEPVQEEPTSTATATVETRPIAVAQTAGQADESDEPDEPDEPAETPDVTATPSITNTPVIPLSGPIIDENYELPPTDTPPPPPTATPEPDTGPDLSITTPLPDLPRLNRSQMGIQIYTNLETSQWEVAMGHIDQLNIGWVKLQVDWRFLQPNNAREFGQEFQLFEMHVQAVKRRGVQLLLSITKAPSWARSTQEGDGPPDDPQALADFITFMLNETKVGESVDAIEIWNEPNLRREWSGTLPFSGAGYMQLFRPAYQAIRAYSPSMPIITAGLAPTSTNAGVSIRHTEYLQQMYDAGLGEFTDIAIGAHPYGWANPPDWRYGVNGLEDRGWDDDPHFFFLDNLEDTHEIMVRNGHGDLQMWVTEFGWATWAGLPTEAPEVWMNFNTPDDQAAYALRAWQIGQELDYVGPMILWNLNFANPALVEQQQEVVGYSLLLPADDDDGQFERPLYWILQVME